MTTDWEKDRQKTLRETDRLLKEAERFRTQIEKEREKDRKEARKREAQSLTEKAGDASSECYRLVYSGLREPIVIDWESLKQRESFPKEAPAPPRTILIAPAPDKQDLFYSAVLSVWDRLSPKRRDARTAEAATRFEEDTRRWKERKATIEAQNAQAAREYATALAGWEGERAKFVSEQDEHNQLINAQKEAYFALDREAVVHYCDLVLCHSSYPEWIPKAYDIDYVPSTKTLSVDHWLPTADILPAVKEVKYVAAQDEFTYVLVKPEERRLLFDLVLSSVAIRTLGELYMADAGNALDSIVFHGWIRSIVASTGREVNTCVASMQVDKKKFIEIDLPRVIPWICFTSLGGVTSARPRDVSPIRLTKDADKEDK